jgi:hypothetical protein
MRFEPEVSDPANAGRGIVRDVLHEVGPGRWATKRRQLNPFGQVPTCSKQGTMFSTSFNWTVRCHSTQANSGQNAYRGRARNGPGRYNSPHHRRPFNSRNEGSTHVWVTWRTALRCPCRGVYKKHSDVISQADLWTLAGALSIEFAGGPHVPHALGRVDDTDGAKCPMPGRLPDASQGAAHLRDVFHRMVRRCKSTPVLKALGTMCLKLGDELHDELLSIFTFEHELRQYRVGLGDRDIVALSGAHTLGRCHLVRSGYDGKWRGRDTPPLPASTSAVLVTQTETTQHISQMMFPLR